MESRLNDMRIFGMPVQFVVVVAISLALTIYFGAWAADARMNERAAHASVQTAQQFNFGSATTASSGAGLAGGLSQAQGGAGNVPGYGVVAEGEGWEKFFLFACPLH